MAGRGRGLALLEVLKKSRDGDTESRSSGPTPTISGPTPSSQTPTLSGITDTSTMTPSSAPSSVSTVGGRGRGALLMLSKMQKPTLESVTAITPSGDSISQTSSETAGPSRGRRQLEQMKLMGSMLGAATPGSQGDVAVVTSQMKEATISDKPALKPRNKVLNEIKDTPPVVMKGSTGKPCNVTANYIYLKFEENNAFEYDVRFNPDQDFKQMRNKLLFEHKDIIKVNSFDGTTLYLPHALPSEVTELTSTIPSDGSSVKITITFRRTRKLSEMIHLYNVLFKQIMRDLELVRFGREHFNQHSAIPIPQHKLEVWPGYVTAVSEYEGGLMLTLDSTHRVLRTENVYDLLRNLSMKGGNWKETFNNELLGRSVMTTYNKKLYTVNCVAFDKNPKTTFPKVEHGVEVLMPLHEYYKKYYDINLKYIDQPLLISKKSKRQSGTSEPKDFMFYLIPELCQLTGLSDDQRSNFHLMKDVATYTRITPNQRHFAFKEFIKNVLNNKNASNRLTGWGLSIAPETISLTARTLPPEPIYFGNDIVVAGKQKADWNMDVTRNPVMSAVDIVKWVILFPKREERVAQDFKETMLRCSHPMGINVANPDMVVLQSDDVGAYVRALREVFNAQLQLVVAICPNLRDDRYEAIKKICCADQPIPSQVIASRTLKNTQKLRAITQKIALQINCKLGGTLWHIKIPIKSCMVIGIDSYHDPRRKNRSVCAFVASYNQSLTQWYSRAVFQDKGQEIVDSLKACINEALDHYLRCNATLPAKIIMYRDGIGDGVLNVVKNYEIPQLQVSFSLYKKEYTPSLTYIVVQKRINTRIFMKLNGHLENPDPGTVLDHGITRRDWYDFLIVSQKVNQGTVTPSHYIVVHDDSGMTPDHCQRLTYKLCHLYYNWPGTVRVPAPCQYAHKLAYLIGNSVKRTPSTTLADRLFFL